MSDNLNSNKIKAKRIIAFFKLAILLIILIGIPAYIYFFHHEIIDSASSIEKVHHLLSGNNSKSIPIYIIAQFLQVVICIIPGQWLQLAASIGWGFWLGYLFSIIGAGLGSITSYYLAKLLGRDAMHIIFSEEKIEHYTEKLNSKKGILLLFVIFLIPGLPKDLCTYAAGLSEMKLKPFLFISLAGRTPGMMGSLLVGKCLAVGSYRLAIIVSVTFVILLVCGLIFHKWLLSKLDDIYAKISEM